MSEKIKLKMLVHPEPVTLASFARTQGPIGQISSKVYEGLLTYDDTMQPLPGLARDWAVSEDAKTYTFTLHKNVTFHDGQPLTSQDVAFSFMEVLRNLHPRGRTTLKSLEHVETPNPETVIFHFADPHPFFLVTLSGIESPILSSQLRASGALEAYTTAEQPNGTGPYSLREWRRGDQIVLDRNNHHRDVSDDTPDEVHIHFEPDAQSRTDKILSGAADVSGMGSVSWSAAETIRKKADIDVTTTGAQALNPILILDMNLSHASLDDINVRDGLTNAINRNALLEEIFFGYGQAMYGPIHSNWHKAGLVTDDFSTSKLSKQLSVNALAGLKLTLDVIPYGEEWIASAEMICGMLRDHDVQVELRVEDFEAWMDRIFIRRDFDLNLNYLHYYMDPALSLNRLYHSKMAHKGITFANSSGWSSPETDTLLDIAAIEPNKEKRAAYYGRLDRVLRAAMPSVWLAEINPVTAIKDSRSNLLRDPFGVYGAMNRIK